MEVVSIPDERNRGRPCESMVRKRKPLKHERTTGSPASSKVSNRGLYASAKLESEPGSVDRVIRRLLDIQGVVACHRLTEKQLRVLIHTETKSNQNLRLPGLEIVNEGIRDVSGRRSIVAVAHTPKLRHPPGPILVICSDSQVVGEEIWNDQPIDDSNTLLLGRGLKLYRTALEASAGKPLKILYRALRFPELETITGVRDVISVTVNAQTHMRLSRLVGWDERDPNLGTVVIGFNR